MVATIERRQLEEQGQELRHCIHCWVIEDVGGRTSEGACKYCGERKVFNNYISDCVRTNEEDYELWLSRQKV